MGDTIAVTLKANAVSYTNTTGIMSFKGSMEFQSDFSMEFITEDSPRYKVCVGSDESVIPIGFNTEDSITYKTTLKKEFVGKLKTFWIVFRSNAGESVWGYDRVEDK